MGDHNKRRRLALDKSEAYDYHASYRTYIRPDSKSSTQQPISTLEEEVNPWTNVPFSPRYFEILNCRKTLPIFDSKAKLLSHLKKFPVTVLQGETGSGKTTQVPQFLVEGGYCDDGKMVCCTQPRRIAAMSVAKRVAEEMDVTLGNHVGYTIRFEDRTSEQTVLKYMTDGMLLREAMSDPNLTSYSAIVLDEAHERTLSTDILLGLVKTVLEKRDDLRVVIMSATLDAAKFQDYFNGAPLLSVSGRLFPVEVFYSKEPEDDYVEAAIRTAVEVYSKCPPGDILVFLTGEEEIEECCKKIEEEVRRFERRCGPVNVLPLYGSLPPDRQQRVFTPPPPPLFRGGPCGRKIICATNIAETSLTIDGVVYVIDTGFTKQKIYNPRCRVENLTVQPISRASAKQRAGRAGRTRPGNCYRLYTKEDFEESLEDKTHPEILRSNLCNVVLHLKKLGIEDLVHFDFIEPPAPESLMRALELLNYLGALDDEGDMTEFGSKMSEFPLEPESSAALIKSPKFKCSEEVLTIVAMLSAAQNCFIRPPRRNGKAEKKRDGAKRGFEHQDGDHMTLLNVYHAYKLNATGKDGGSRWCWDNYINFRSMKMADSIRTQLGRLMRKCKIELISGDVQDVKYSSNIRRAILNGYFMQVAHKSYMKTKDSKQGTNYLTVKDNQRMFLHPSCGLKGKPQWVMYHESVATKKDYLRTCSEIKGIWLLETAPHYYDLSNFPEGEAKRDLQRMYSRKERKREDQ